MAFQAPGAPATDGAAPSPTASAAEPIAHAGPQGARRGHGFWALSLGSIGVVFGDIGTSPLYAFKSAMEESLRDGASRPGVLGVVSLALWALILVVTVKYVLFLM